MSNTDQLLEQYQDNLLRKNQGEDISSDEDQELLDLLEDGEGFDNYREKRIEELSKQMKAASHNIDQGFGHVETLLNEESALQKTTSTPRVVLHFFHKDFTKCQKMDEKLSIMASKHLSTKFLRINVEDAPFLVTRLKIKVLPMVLIYINGVESNRIIGFDKLNFDKNAQDFQIESLEKFLLDNGMYIICSICFLIMNTNSL
ncbi:Thioredoxin domain-containing protein 9 [Wickerhamomyces ciferrii]|uniref:Thioredoxin domain-containing protein 9 n=1 Tax=Wickerhamomyces ciferrii (strain ATCC 14091 / BCRC 22168 / CBS 111 / JCM 3599 / NBRC 0793 / NRRL Y-1031 F-60-10) TaxID=1206466 RepID=K0KDR8_WICCF|nr:Thioredoxin domain-containing protein 9 [Wickerhamomyces ciferrii]CCH43250.1 Thioredoxin domain-containing protein 9 [Wickerhamomyces ciferrii]